MEIEFRNIKKSYKGFQLEMDLKIEKGSFVSILGQSGSGKTTSLNLISGIERPDSGSIFFDGINVTKAPLHKRNVGMVFQDYALFPHLNVKNNISYGLKIKREPREYIKTRVKELSSSVRLSGFNTRNPGDLSGGEKQRVALARALAASPGLLLLDEPLSALDASLRFDLRKDIKRIHKEMGITTVYVTHDQLEAFSLSDKIILMEDGRCIQHDIPEYMFSNPATSRAADFFGYRNHIFCGFDNKISKGELLTVHKGESSLTVTAGENINSESLVIKFRPEAAVFQKPVSGTVMNEMSASVGISEFHGKEYQLEVINEWGQLLINSPDKIIEEDEIRFYVNSGDLLAFNTM